MEKKQSELAEALADLEEERVLELVRQRVDAGDDPLAVLEECRAGMRIVGERFEKSRYFLSDLIMSAEIFKNTLAVLEPKLLAGDRRGMAGKVVFGTVQGDIHDIGKDIVVALLKSNGFEVYDLGVDVPPALFVDKLKETGARVLGLSGLITTAFDSMRDTVEALTQAGLRDQVKVMIGGGLVNEEVRAYAGADAWGKDANEAVTLCRQFYGGGLR